MVDHWNADRDENARKGGHPIMRMADEISAALRNAVAIFAGDRGGVLHQTAGDVPGFYLSDLEWKRIQMGDPPIVTPAQITANVTAYEPTNAESWKYGMIFRMTSDASYDVSSLKAIPALPRGLRYLINANTIASGFNFTYKHLAGGQAAGEQIQLGGAVDLVVPPGGVVTVWEDITSAVWRVL